MRCCSGTVVRVGPGKYDKEAEGGRKAMVVKEGDKVRAAAAVGVWWDAPGAVGRNAASGLVAGLQSV